MDMLHILTSSLLLLGGLAALYSLADTFGAASE